MLDHDDTPRNVREAALLVKSPEMGELHLRRARAVFWEPANRKPTSKKPPQAGDCCSREAGESGDLISFPDL